LRGGALHASCKDVWYKCHVLHYFSTVHFKKLLVKMGASTIFSFMKEGWKCVLTLGVPYFIQDVSKNALTNFSREFFVLKKDKIHIITWPDINGFWD